MKILMQLSHRKEFYQTGVPVDTEAKRDLRRRRVPLTNTQRQCLKKMGIKADNRVTEKDVASIAKRLWKPSDNYKIDPSAGQLAPRKMKTSKPKRISKRQARIETLMHREGQGSKRATKLLAKI